MTALAASEHRSMERHSLLLACALVGLVLLTGAHLVGPGARQGTPRKMTSASFASPPFPAPPPPPSRCQLDVAASPWARHCQRLQRVCLDQSTIILYDDQYQELDGKVAGALPKLRISSNKVFAWPWRGREADAAAAAATGANATGSAAGGADAAEEDEGDSSGGQQQDRRRAYEVQMDYHRHLEPPRLRPATAQEPAAYLQSPAFSTCTVPVVLAATWRRNFWHVMDNSAVWFAMARRTPWWEHLKFIALTPDGLGLSHPERQLLPALGPLALQSLGDASARLPPGHPPGSLLFGQEGGPPLSWEGGEQRCFKDLFFCGEKIGTAKGAAPGDARLKGGVPRELGAWGQELVAHVQRQQEQQGQQDQQPRPPNDASDRGGGSRRLKVLFLRRDSEGRQLLNAEELVRCCNGWKGRDPGSGAALTAECRQVSTPDLAAGVAAAQDADILVGIHGANMANSWLMRPGGSTIEVMPYGWGDGPALSLSMFNGVDGTSQLLWWVLVTCDPALSTPGPEEAAGTGSSKWWPRDRNVRLPWPALEGALAQALAAGGSRQRYLEEWFGSRRNLLYVTEDGVAAQGGGGCPAA
ncbi:hypothetical protein ABPG75_003819 [Micractinium tetrahymenae]